MESIERVVLGGGCFWCLDAVFLRVNGVQSAIPGYMGGTGPNPTYEAVCSGTTGHVEVVEVSFDKSVIDFIHVLQIFFSIHDPTTRDRQGADVGSQYRSVIFTHTTEQLTASKQYIKELDAADTWRAPIVTEVKPLGIFYAAEDYHHQYYEANRSQPYCQYVIDPKIEKLGHSWREFLKATP
ncbi:MAG: peptide-methionine (S)-S-oxide reductase [Betaproteobacteria bacterium TMED22]|nr:MAG: peptide-methionine (S)-S-oxide reductase [Betaproteobacteria bacterium TMED22]|tara:strand:- start:96666 stop:97211 length:546 start_codon:yes stop_codon:yes gene_type:complete